MIDQLLSLIAPHYCSGCEKVGTLLCDNCKYNIKDMPFEGCIVCRGVTDTGNLCKRCDVPYQKAWCVGERSDTLQRLIGEYKFRSAKAAYKPISHLLLETLPELPPGTVVVPVPTVRSHIRERGFDHTLLIARMVASARHIKLKTVIIRQTKTKQRDASRSLRFKQAKQAFNVDGQLNPDVPYLLIDDVVTTGATIQYCAEALRDAGARSIWVGIIARQPLD